jgi:hypothetical protein
VRVNLWDAAFAHVPFSVPGRVSKHIEWVRGRPTWDGITVVTDDFLANGHILDVLKSTVTIGWLLETRACRPQNYHCIQWAIDKLDFLFTHDAALLAEYPAKARFVPFGGCWIPDDQWGMYAKAADVSHIYSAKKFMPGHHLRHAIAERFPGIDTYGHGTPRPLVSKAPALAPYRFSIVVENDRAPNYFTEKLLDCFAVGTVPIYWGAPNIGDFFDARGIMEVENIHDVEVVLELIAIHQARTDPSFDADVRQRNMELARAYVLPEDYMYENHLKGMEGK